MDICESGKEVAADGGETSKSGIRGGGEAAVRKAETRNKTVLIAKRIGAQRENLGSRLFKVFERRG